MSFSETIFLFLLALIIFGPKKLPEIARQVGRYLNEFKRASNDFKAQIEQEIAHLENEKPHVTLSSSAPEGSLSRSSSSSEGPNIIPPATLAAPTEAPSNGEGNAASEANSSSAESQPVATEALPADSIASSTSQESHA